MPIIDPIVEAVLLFDRGVGQVRIHFESKDCSSNSAAELWIEQGTAHYVLYQPDEYYDEGLRECRNKGNMISPRDSSRRLVFVGQVWGGPAYDTNACIEMGRTIIGAKK